MKPASPVRPIHLRTILAGLACSATLLFPSQPAQAQTQNASETLRSSDLSALAWRELGPTITSGRITAFAVDPRDTRVIFAASASGGAWKTENAGTTWRPVFENEGSVSLGAIALAPSNPDIVWVGSRTASGVRPTVTASTGPTMEGRRGATWGWRGVAMWGGSSSIPKTPMWSS